MKMLKLEDTTLSTVIGGAKLSKITICHKGKTLTVSRNSIEFFKVPFNKNDIIAGHGIFTKHADSDGACS